MTEWTAAEISDYDQFLSETDAEVDRLVRTLRIGTGDVGEHQAMASVGLLVSRHDPSALTGLLMVALRRLANEGTAP